MADVTVMMCCAALRCPPVATGRRDERVGLDVCGTVWLSRLDCDCNCDNNGRTPWRQMAKTCSDRLSLSRAKTLMAAPPQRAVRLSARVTVSAGSNYRGPDLGGVEPVPLGGACPSGRRVHGRPCPYQSPSFSHLRHVPSRPSFRLLSARWLLRRSAMPSSQPSIGMLLFLLFLLATP